MCAFARRLFGEISITHLLGAGKSLMWKLKFVCCVQTKTFCSSFLSRLTQFMFSPLLRSLRDILNFCSLSTSLLCWYSRFYCCTIQCSLRDFSHSQFFGTLRVSSAICAAAFQLLIKITRLREKFCQLKLNNCYQYWRFPEGSLSSLQSSFYGLISIYLENQNRKLLLRIFVQQWWSFTINCSTFALTTLTVLLKYVFRQCLNEV